MERAWERAAAVRGRWYAGGSAGLPAKKGPGGGAHSAGRAAAPGPRGARRSSGWRGPRQMNAQAPCASTGLIGPVAACKPSRQEGCRAGRGGTSSGEGDQQGQRCGGARQKAAAGPGAGRERCCQGYRAERGAGRRPPARPPRGGARARRAGARPAHGSAGARAAESARAPGEGGWGRAGAAQSASFKPSGSQVEAKRQEPSAHAVLRTQCCRAVCSLRTHPV